MESKERKSKQNKIKTESLKESDFNLFLQQL